MKSLNKFVLAFMSLAVIVGGYALLTTSNDSAEAEKAQVANKLALQNDVDEVGDVDEVDDEDEKIVAPQSGTISEARAISIAEATYKGDGKRTEVELEMEGGVLVYAVEFTEKDGNEVDVKINAKTGIVLKIESDKTEKDDDEDDED